MKQTIRLITGTLCVLLLGTMTALGQQTVNWRTTAANGNWFNGDCSEIGTADSQWEYPGFGGNSSRNEPDCSDGITTRHMIYIDNNHELVMNVNEVVGINRLILNTNATNDRTISGEFIDLYFVDTDKPKIENYSTATHTINNGIAFQGNPSEINPVNGNLVFSSDIYQNGNFLDVYGGEILTIDGNLQDGSGAGGVAVKDANVEVVFSNTAKGYTGATYVENGILSASVSLSTSSIQVQDGGTFNVTENISINSLEIQSGGTVNIAAGKTLTIRSGSYYLNNGTVNLNTTGSINFEREISGNAGWRMLSFPITGGTVEDISDNTAIQGVTDGDHSDKDSNFMTYDSDGSFETPTNVSTAIGDGYGFITYFYDNTTAGSTELPITLDASGAEPSSQVSVNLNKTTLSNGAYYTLVGNPFASNYDLNQITVTGGAINNNVQFWDDGAGSYATQDRTTPFIASPWQGFWVEVASANGATSIEFPTAGKSTSGTTATYFSKANSQKGDIHFELKSENSFDKAIRLSFREDAEMSWDLDDASKFIPLIESYATLGFVGEERLQSVFSLPYDLQENHEIEMQESLVGVSGEFTLSWEGMETLPEGVTLEFNDYKTGESVDMNMVSSYTFEASETAEKRANPLTMLKSPVAEVQKAKSTEDGRFGITVRSKSATSNEPTDAPEQFTLEQNYPNPFNPTTSIQYSVAEAGDVSLTVYNVMGQRVETLVSGTKAPGTYRVSWDAANMASGIYYYRLHAGNQVLTRQMTLIK